MTELMNALYIGDNYGGAYSCFVPPQMLPGGEDPMGRIAAMGQLAGNPAEQLCELAGRICYGSLGTGRNTEKYFEHILEVGHLSVLEHVNFTIFFPIATDDSTDIALFYNDMGNHPGTYVVACPAAGGAMIGFNLRAAIEFSNFPVSCGTTSKAGLALREAAHIQAPHIMERMSDSRWYNTWPEERELDGLDADELRWITLYLSGSRGFSHELVRHKYRTAVSQRSTRYVDESQSDWVEHPLLTAYEDEHGDERGMSVLLGQLERSAADARSAYDKAVTALQLWLITIGVDKFTARKQARGTARGYLGNALFTECLFSASVAQWKRIFRMRCADAADAEIRTIMVKALDECRRSRYGDCFMDDEFDLVTSSDGLGLSIVGQK